MRYGISRLAFPLLAVLISVSLAWGQTKPTHKKEFPARIGVSGGMGVALINPQSIVNQVNGINANVFGVGTRVDDFKTAIEFYGACSVPFNGDVVLKIEYAYLFGSYNTGNVLGTGEFSFQAHMPSLIVQYVLMDAGVYNLRGGIGGGYHFGQYSEKYSTADKQYTGAGPGFIADIEANTAFGENLYGNIGGNIRAVFIGDLKDAKGQSPGIAGSTTNLNFIGAGVRFGFTYYF